MSELSSGLTMTVQLPTENGESSPKRRHPPAVDPIVESLAGSISPSSGERPELPVVASAHASDVQSGGGINTAKAMPEIDGTSKNNDDVPGQQQTPSDGAVEYDGTLRGSQAPSTGFAITSRPPTSAGSERQRPKGSAPRQHHFHTYGNPVTVNTEGSFPSLGSILGPYFCLGQLGSGTFSSIHKCLDMTYEDPPRPKLAAAKVELSTFNQSGVLDSEAAILDYLYRVAPKCVPRYLGHYKSSKGDAAALVMEYLAEDMHNLREKLETRRLSVPDAVELTAGIMLPLLQQLHDVGIVHRDVKPSNCVRKSSQGKEFCLVDFGLSKSICVPETSELADTNHLWTGKHWMRPHQYNGKACFRKERGKAEFRGTSMYASLRVHQLCDYCPRDDMYSLLYVFCDLVSGGLPWMSYAANRDRAKCQEIKEICHGEFGDRTRDETDRLLMGDAYHIAKYRQETAKDNNSKPIEVPEALSLSKNVHCVSLLRKAFAHLSSLQFWDRPDYKLIEDCIRGFLDYKDVVPATQSIEWDTDIGSQNIKLVSGNFPPLGTREKIIPKWCLEESFEPTEVGLFEDIVESSETIASSKLAKYFVLPVELRFRIAQMEYNLARPNVVPMHRALDDWMAVVLPLLYGEWDTPKFERDPHRTSTDGRQRPLYLDLLERCWLYAQEYNEFQSLDCYFQVDIGNSDAEVQQEKDTTEGYKESRIVIDSTSYYKRRRIAAEPHKSYATVSGALFQLDRVIDAERAKKAAPSTQQNLFG